MKHSSTFDKQVFEQVFLTVLKYNFQLFMSLFSLRLLRPGRARRRRVIEKSLCVAGSDIWDLYWSEV